MSLPAPSNAAFVSDVDVTERSPPTLLLSEAPYSADQLSVRVQTRGHCSQCPIDAGTSELTVSEHPQPCRTVAEPGRYLLEGCLALYLLDLLYLLYLLYPGRQVSQWFGIRAKPVKSL